MALLFTFPLICKNFHFFSSPTFCLSSFSFPPPSLFPFIHSSLPHYPSFLLYFLPSSFLCHENPSFLLPWFISPFLYHENWAVICPRQKIFSPLLEHTTCSLICCFSSLLIGKCSQIHIKIKQKGLSRIQQFLKRLWLSREVNRNSTGDCEAGPGGDLHLSRIWQINLEDPNCV